MPLALICLPRRRSMLSSIPSSSGPVGTNAATSNFSSRRAANRLSQTARFSTRCQVTKCRSWRSPMMRRMLHTVRWPGTSSAPSSSICACCQVRACTNTGANATRIVAKRAGTCNMAASPGRDPPGYAYPLRHPIGAPLSPPINGQSRTEKREVFVSQIGALLDGARDERHHLVYLDEAHIHQDVDLGYGWGERGQRFQVASSSPGLKAKVSFYGLYLYNEGQVRIWPYDRAEAGNTIDVLRRLRAE